jgi:type II secretory pathway component PulF
MGSSIGRPSIELRLWLWLGAGVLLLAVASAGLVWLLWRYVPYYAALFEGLGLELSPQARLVIVCSSWTGRLLPLAVLAAIPLLGLFVALVVLAAVKGESARWIVKTLTALVLAAAMVEMLACGFVVHSMRSALERATSSVPGPSR